MKVDKLLRAMVPMIHARTISEAVQAIVRALAALDGVALVQLWLKPPGAQSFEIAAGAGDADLALGMPKITRPLALDGAVSGLLVVWHRHAAFDVDMDGFAEHAAAALDNAAAFERLAQEGNDQRQASQETLRETQAALKFALESAQIGDWDLDLVHDTSRRSLRHDQCFGYFEPIPESEWGIEAFIRHVHPDDRARVERGLRSAARAQQNFHGEFRVIWPDGSVHWLVARGNIYRTIGGRASRMLGIVMDIGERKRNEEALDAAKQVALGHVEALTHTLDKLAAESAPSRLAEHVLRTIAAQLGAQSCSVWRRDVETGLFDFQASLEDGLFRARTDPAFRGVSLRIAMDDHWREALIAGQPVVMEDIRQLQDSAWRAKLMALGVVTVLMVPMSIGGRAEGTIGIRFNRKRGFRDGEIDLAKALANQTMLMLQLTRLSEEASASAVVAERNRMARDIHDTLAQGFTGVIVQLEAASDARSRGLANEADHHVERARELARESLSEARRSVRALRPKELEDKELSEALEAMIRKMTAGTPVAAEFSLIGDPSKLPPAWEENLMRIVQEVLTNALRHARAERFRAQLEFEAEKVHLLLEDDGRGFDPARKHDGLGLLGIGERVAAMAGTMKLRTHPGAGMNVSIVLPLVGGTASLAS